MLPTMIAALLLANPPVESVEKPLKKEIPVAVVEEAVVTEEDALLALEEGIVDLEAAEEEELAQ